MKILTALFATLFLTFSAAHAEVTANTPELPNEVKQTLQSENANITSLLEELIKGGMSLTDAVSAMISAAPAKAASITTAAIILSPEQVNEIIAAASIQTVDPTLALAATAAGPTPGIPSAVSKTSRPTSSGGGSAASPV